MRKAFIINSLSNGGAERVVTNLANELSKDGHDVHVILLKDKIDYKIESNIKVHKIQSGNGKFKKLLYFKKTRLLLFEKIKEIEQEFGVIDLITVHLPFPHFLFESKEFEKKTYYAIHTVYSKKFTKFKPVFKRVLGKLYNKKKLISVSQGVANELTGFWGIKPSDNIVIHNPVDIKEIKSKANEEIVHIDKYIIAVGRLVKLKRFDFLMDAFNKSGKYKDYKLVILGDGPEKNNLLMKSKDMGISEKVIFAGWQDNPYAWMKNADLFVLSSEYEAFPMVLIEALACDTPIVSVDCNYGPREILVDELADFLVPVGNTDILAAKINQALEDYPIISDKYTARFKIENIINQYLELLNR